MSDKFTEINDIMNESNNTNAFIKDYILRYRFAELAVNSASTIDIPTIIASTPTRTMVENFKKDADDINDRYNEDIQNTCSSDNISSYCSNDNLKGLKDNINQMRDKYMDMIIKQSNSIKNYGTNSGLVTEYMLYDLYSEYINGDDFVYDENNPYIVELFYHITSFMGIRERLEYNSTNLPSLMTNFRNMCEKTLKKYWKDSSYEYYRTLKNRFIYDFYADNDKLEKAGLNDVSRVTLYEKVLDYLKNITGYTKPKSTSESLMNVDVNSLTSMSTAPESDNDKAMKDLESKLKKIAIAFVQIKRIETGSDSEYMNNYIDDSLVSDMLDTNGNPALLGLVESYNTIMETLTPETIAIVTPELTPILSSMQMFVAPLKRLTEKESLILKDLTDRAIRWYRENQSKIDSGEIFNQFREASWPSPTTIYKDSEKHDFFFIENPMAQEEPEEPDEYEYTEDSLRTKHGIDSIEYWRKYCTVATQVNCILPIYWATGLIISGAPIPLPIIYLPIMDIPGRVTIVIGLGICGISVSPMVLFVNLGDIPGSLVPIMNILIDNMKKIPPKSMKAQNKGLEAVIKSLIEKQDEKINRLNQEKDDLNIKIQNLKNGVETDKHVLRDLRKKRKENSTTKRKGAY